MLLQGAYSAKYRAARQETVENLRDEERQEFNVKLEKNKELSRDTNRRRRALEQRRKDYEAEEERKRREILAQRRKQIQEATEKFQRANFVKSRKKTNNYHPHRSKANKKVKHERTEPGLVTKHTKSGVNGQPYYPSVEEVLAMLHADRADVIGRLASGETHDHLQTRDYDYTPVGANDLRAGSPPEGQPPVPYCNTNDSAGSTEGTKVTPEQRIIDQEKLRSEVVGRTQPRLAFGDGTKDITEGVLPTTIRRNSPSGSLSSLDSLDEVPDEVLEPAGAGPVPVMEDPLEGIIRKAEKIKSGSRVTFNESVIFSDGFVGTLKKKQEIANDVSGAFGIAKQTSYFEIMGQGTSQGEVDDETPGIELPKYLDTNANVVTSKSLQDTPVLYPPENSTRPTTDVSKYTVSTADVTTACVTSYSKTNGGLASGGTMNEIKNLTTTPVRNSDGVRRGQYCQPRDVGGEHKSYIQMAVRKFPVTSGNTLGDKTRETVNTVANGEKPSSQNVGHGVETHGEMNGFHPERQSNRLDGKTIETTRVPFSCINGSMLKDSLEMSYGNTTSSQSQSSTEPTHTPSVESRMRGTEDVEALPETPLIPVTKKDFLSKALLRATNNAHDDLKSRTGLNNQKQREGVKSGYNTNGVLHNGHDFTGRCIPNASETAKINGYKSDVYTQGNEYGTRGISGIQGHNGTTGVVPNAYDMAKRNGYESDIYRQGYKYGGTQGHNGTPGIPNGNDTMDHNGYESDVYKQGYGARNIMEVRGHNGTNGVIPNGSDATRRNGCENDTYLKQGYQYGAMNSRGLQGQGGTGENNSSKTLPKSRLVGGTTNKESLTNGQTPPAPPKASSTALNGSGSKNVQEGRMSTAIRKGNSGEDLLKSVQEDIERISMLPAQQNASATYSDQRAVPSANHKSRRKPTASDQGRKPTKKRSPIGGKPKLKEGKKRINSTTKRFHKPTGESGSGIRKQTKSAINIQYASSPNDNQDYSPSNRNLTYNQNHSPSPDTSSRLPETEKRDPNSGSRPLEYYSHREPSWASTFERKQRRNREGVEFLDKTPTDEEINTLWETVRTCLKHEQSHKAASDSIVNNIRHSRSESGPLVGNHYLIDSNRWGEKPRGVTDAFGLNSTGSEPRQTTVGDRVSFRRQNSLDGFERRASSDNSTASLPVRKGSLLEHRKHKTERRLPRTQQSARPPLNPQSFQARRGPMASASGPQKSNTGKAEESKRPHLSYVEFQAVMQASADLQTRDNEGETQRRPQQALHQPIIMNYRKEPSALSLEEKRLLESLDRLNERLKVQEGFSGKLTKGQINPNMQASPAKFLHTSPSNSRFGSNRNSAHKSFATSPSLLNRR